MFRRSPPPLRVGLVYNGLVCTEKFSRRIKTTDYWVVDSWGLSLSFLKKEDPTLSVFRTLWALIDYHLSVEENATVGETH